MTNDRYKNYCAAVDASFARLPTMSGVERVKTLRRARRRFESSLRMLAVDDPREKNSLTLSIQGCLTSCKEGPFVSEGSGFRFTNGLYVNYRTWDYWGRFVDQSKNTLSSEGRAILTYLNETFGEVDVLPAENRTFAFVRKPVKTMNPAPGLRARDKKHAAG